MGLQAFWHIAELAPALTAEIIFTGLDWAVVEWTRPMNLLWYPFARLELTVGMYVHRALCRPSAAVQLGLLRPQHLPHQVRVEGGSVGSHRCRAGGILEGQLQPGPSPVQ